jgi:hypothetical protein
MSYDKVSLLLPMFGEDNGTLFPDFSPVPKTVTRTGVVTSTAQSKYYGSSALFSGSATLLSIQHDSLFNIEQSDFCIESWVYLTSNDNPQVLIAKRKSSTASSQGWSFNVTPSVYTFQYNGGSSITYNGTLPLNEWIHVAVSRQGSTVRLFLNGNVVETNSSFANGSLDTVSTVVVGRAGSDLASGYIKGHVQDLNIIKGSALYTGAFTTPDRLIGNISGTITDDAGDPAVRTVYAVPRAAPLRTFGPVQSASDGTYSLHVPITECSRIVLDDDAAPLYNDLIDRVIPQ